jgi:hypothetical protein
LAAKGADDRVDDPLLESTVSAPKLNLCVGALTGALLLASIGCAVKPGSQAGGVNPILGDGISNGFDAVAMVDPEARAKVDDCVDSATLNIYAGDPEWRRTWVDVGESDSGLRGFCEDLASWDPARFDRIHTDWVAWEAAVAAENGVPAPTPAPPPETVPTSTEPPPVLYDPSGCHPSYTPCVPISADVDCRGDSGDGPVYVKGPIQVIGYDEYRIDDGDGIACEPE